MAFNFGNTSTSGQSSGGLFGTAGAYTSSSGTGFSFGQSAATAGGAESKSGGLFGGGSGNIFGKQGENKSTDTKSTFGGFGAPSQTPGTPAQQPSTSLFGSTTPAAIGGGIFGGNSSTTPAGLPPAGSMFGASTGVSNNQAPPAQKPAFSFGNKTAATSATGTAPVTQTSSGLFGQTASSQPTSGGNAFSSGIFGAKSGTPSATQAGQTSNLFGGQAGGATKPIETATQPGSLFGAKPVQGASQPTSTGGFSFGQPKKDDKPTDNTAQKPAFSFPTTGGSSSSAIPQLVSTQSTTPSLFNPTGSKDTSAAGKPAPLFGSLLGGAGAGATTTGADSSSSAPSASSGFFKPNLPASASTASSTANVQAPSTTATAPTTTTGFSGFNLGGATSQSGSLGTTASTAPATNTPLSGFKLPTTSASSTSAIPSTTATVSAPTISTPAAAATSTATLSRPQGFSASTMGPPAPAQSRLRNKTMDEILTRWASDLTRYTKDFKQHAEQIAKWDQIIVDNSTKIDKLYVKTRTCEKQTMSVEMQLAAVENQQNELEAWLGKYENDVDEMLAKDGPASQELGGPDQERERTYKLAERLGERLDDMESDLKSMIEEVNSANAEIGGGNKADEPITQIVKILNAHLSQLQAIDQGTTMLQTKVAAAQQAAQGMNYMNVHGSLSGDNTASVDGFYRSFMGRR